MKQTSRTAALAILIAFSFGSTAQAQAPIFVVHSDEFWLNLHHFLFVLGQAQGRDPGTLREAVQNAPADAQRGLESLTPDENDVWSAAVTTYTNGLSQRDPVQDEGHALMIATLAAAGDSRTLRRVDIDSEVRTTLESVAPAAGFAVHVSSYANFGIAYSSGFSGVLVLPSSSNLNAGLYGLETIVHEAMHQWDGQMFTALRALAEPSIRTVPQDLPHALIFYTAGQAVRSVEPAHVPMADALDIWALRLSGATLPAARLKPLLEEIWQPRLMGRGTRDDALAALVARAGAASQP